MSPKQTKTQVTWKICLCNVYIFSIVLNDITLKKAIFQFLFVSLHFAIHFMRKRRQHFCFYRQASNCFKNFPSIMESANESRYALLKRPMMMIIILIKTRKSGLLLHQSWWWQAAAARWEIHFRAPPSPPPPPASAQAPGHTV